MNTIVDFFANGLVHASGWEIFFYTLAVTHITIVSVTLFLHRCQAHRALDLHPVVSHFFRFWLWLTTGQVTKQWAAIHRKHHAKCETEEDPHSPVTRGIKKVFWQGAELYRAEAKNQETLAKYGHGTPDDWIERALYSRFTWQGVVLMLIINIMLFGAIGVTVWAIQMLWIPVNAAGIINGIGHYWGYRNYDVDDASTNIVPFGIFIGGEELHNNHHTFATSAKFSTKWYEIDIGWMYVCLLQAVGLAKVKKVPPEPKLLAAKTFIDQTTLQSVITNRYEVTAKYTKSLKKIWRAELDHLRKIAKLEDAFLASSKKLLQREPTKLRQVDMQQLRELFAHSRALKTMHEMRIELNSIWERSNDTRDQLVQKLQEWCTRAEESGIQALQEFSWRLRRYA